MKRTLFQALTLATVLAGSGAFSSLAASEKLTVDVPFSFVVGTKEFAAGHYRVEQNNDGTIFVQGEGQGAAVLSVPAELEHSGPATSLRFTANQSREYLTGVQMEGETNRAIPVKAFTDHKVTVSSR
jgi:carbon monoxide dehydrogenase subunit G